jgi:hypothetical protein
MDELAEQIDFVMSHFLLKSIIGFGVGAGANVLARFALAHPEKVCMFRQICRHYRGILRHLHFFHFLLPLQAAGSRPGEMNEFFHLLLPTALGSGVYSSSNRNEYQKQKNNVSG